MATGLATLKPPIPGVSVSVRGSPGGGPLHVGVARPRTAQDLCGCGGTGRRTGFRFQRRKAWRFESSHPHHRFHPAPGRSRGFPDHHRSCFVLLAALQPVMAPVARKGRGACTNASGRFEPVVHEAVDDGWTDEDQTPAPLRTTLTPEHARTIITKNTSPDIGFDRSINPYKGCEHGCIY